MRSATERDDRLQLESYSCIPSRCVHVRSKRFVQTMFLPLTKFNATQGLSIFEPTSSLQDVVFDIGSRPEIDQKHSYLGELKPDYFAVSKVAKGVWWRLEFLISI